jgi:hypothetical protein
MERKLKITDLLDRDVIRNDKPYEFMNKMTDSENDNWEKETELFLLEEGVEKKYPDWNSSFLAKTIDYEILYGLFKIDYKESKRDDKIKNILDE